MPCYYYRKTQDLTRKAYGSDRTDHWVILGNIRFAKATLHSTDGADDKRDSSRAHSIDEAHMICWVVPNIPNLEHSSSSPFHMMSAMSFPHQCHHNMFILASSDFHRLNLCTWRILKLIRCALAIKDHFLWKLGSRLTHRTSLYDRPCYELEATSNSCCPCQYLQLWKCNTLLFTHNDCKSGPMENEPSTYKWKTKYASSWISQQPNGTKVWYTQHTNGDSKFAQSSCVWFGSIVAFSIQFA